MKITSVTATTHEITIDVPHRDETRTRRVPFVQIETDEGVTGYGQTGDHWWFGVREIINRDMAPVLEGMNPLENERVGRTLQQKFNPRHQTGAWSSAVSAIDIALWDIKGKYLEQPVWRLLGGAQNPVPAYITFGLKTFTKEQLIKVAEKYVADGQDKLKMKVAVEDGTNPRRDAERIGAVREAIGEDVELMIDANYEFPFNNALELCNRVEQYNLTWFEEPVYGNDVKLLAKLRDRSRVPISAGQNEGHRFRHRDLIEGGAIDVCQPNVLYVGGFTEGRKVAALAEAYNLNIANGAGWPFHNMQLHAGVPNGWRVEFHYVHWQVSKKIYKDLPEPVEGMLTLPETPGVGVEPDIKALEKYKVE